MRSRFSINHDIHYTKFTNERENSQMASSIHVTVNDEFTPPIFQLNHDILGYIFALNADLEEEQRIWTRGMHPAIVTLRHTSQVCAHWRELVIGSPSLWARVLDIDLLCQKKEEWRKEVMRRTGTAPLHFRVCDDRSSWFQTPETAAAWLLGEHWTRIRSLDLDFSWYFTRNKDVWLELFQRPAPSLEVFKFAWPCTEPPGYLYGPDFVLFSQQAPSLRTLGATNMRLDLTTFPLPNLRELILHSTVVAADLLKALSHMPVLEVLEPKTDRPFRRVRVNQDASLPTVLLPRLASIKFRVLHSVDIALSFLEHIIPANSCALRFEGKYTDELPGIGSEDLHGRVLSKYSKSSPELGTNISLEINLAPYRFLFGMNLSYRDRFSFSIESGEGSLPEGSISTLLSSFTVVRLDTIRKLVLQLDFEAKDSLSPEITKFIISLVAVEEFQTDPPTLNSLLHIQGDTTAVIMPSLRTLWIYNIGEQDAYQLVIVADFVNARIKLGSPVDTLTVLMGRSVMVDVEPLRKLVPGLAVQML
ncbi:hypothetical protein GALMADRAFT_880574 [Galerina marginata CBS 339.88]|uniref:F-box domain-containing protein n=1 Tax=Galerina marginata (strain CBS 339.88) TaxID=685588 RepID=A0A067SKW0_GALM3|nr:hypothetical protein GALMADRAFT_880574 [Galerina marginata CBS 339.88]